MAGNAKRATKKLQELESVFTALPKEHRKRPVWKALTQVSTASEKNQKRFEDHLNLALSLMEAGS